MTTTAANENNLSELNESSFDDETDHEVKSIELSKNSEYQKLLELFQNGEFAECKEILEKLEKSYPGHPSLLEFKDDLEMRLSLKSISTLIEMEEKRKKKKIIFNKTFFAIISLVVILAAFFVSFYYMNSKATAKQLEIENSQLMSLNDQAEQLLLTGQPKPAEEIIEKIRSINPEYENLPQLTSRMDQLLQLESKYQTALDLAAENKNEEALQILREIEVEQPGLWDVSRQIASLETSFQIARYLEEGNSAYQAGNWDQLISAYENVLELDPELDDPVIEEQLFQGYMNKIINMLENEDTSAEDVEIAEEYYRRAIAIASQNKAFASSRGNLQKVSSELLELKYSQTAKTILADKNQTVTSIAKAVSYLRKAANINPDNANIQTELKNAEYYQIGFKNFIEMEWVQAITNFEWIKSADSDFADGNVDVLLFEAYYALAKQYYLLGLYLDAIRNLEQAEILAWHDSNNLMKLFQVQVFIGDVYGKIEDYQNAVSYYKYALSAVQAYGKLVDYPSITQKLSQANAYEFNSDYENAFASFQEVLADIEVIYTLSEKEIGNGVCLAFFANENLSTVDAILEANDLQKNMVITFGRKLAVPIIEK